MTVTATPRLALPQYSAGSDHVITRAELDAAFLSIETNVALFKEGTFALRPAAAAANAGMFYLATDTGVRFYSNGTTWTAVAASLLVARLTADVAITSTSEQNLFSTTVPAGLLTTASDLSLDAWGFLENESGGSRNHTLRINWGSALAIAFGPFAVASGSSSTGTYIWHLHADIANQGSLSNQLINARLLVGLGQPSGSSSAAMLLDTTKSFVHRVQAAVNTALATALAVTGEISATGTNVVVACEGALLTARGL